MAFLGLGVLWIAAAVVLAVIEAFTLGLTTIWFTVGAVAAAISTLFGASVFVQIVIFLGISILLLYFTKPLQKKLKIGKEKTNVEAVVGKHGFVIEVISPAAFGQVKIGGQAWTAISANPNETIEKETEVMVAGIEGVKLIVVPDRAPTTEV